MKKIVFVLLALVSLLSIAQSMAQTQPVAAPAPAPAAPELEQFLATLSGGQTQTLNDLKPAPSFTTGCNSRAAQCPTGQLCCYLCGNPPEGDDSGCWACVTPYKGGCPMVV